MIPLRSLTPAVLLCVLTLASPARAQNAIVVENALPGSPPSAWDVAGAGDPSIQGFATDASFAPGETVELKVDTDATDYRVDVYRLGWYGGDGARLVASVEPSAALPQLQPACLSDPATGLVDCGNWAASASWPVPANAVSGIYLARLVREDPEDGRASHVVFVVRDDEGGSPLLFQTSDTTWQAYNPYGGNSLYTGGPGPGRAYAVSYNRPNISREATPEDSVFNAAFPMLRWLERNGYDVSYTTGVDTDRRGTELLEHQVFLSVGHDEYWSDTQRQNVEAARDAGVHLAFFSGNEVFWKTRWEATLDGSGTPHRTLVSYKETHAGAKIDPEPAWTGTWRDPRFSPPADGGRPENALTGTIFTVNCCSYPLEVPAADGKMRFWRDTSVATLLPGEVATLPDETLGYEWDEDPDNGFRPPGLVRLSTTSVAVPQLLQDFGSSYAPGTATHHLTLHRAASGALVFGAGTVQWPWGLDATHDRGGQPADPRMQQATVNLMADMGVQPETLQAGLAAATQSTDATPPASTITSPSDGATVVQPVTVTGAATDAGGGVVGAVEVSIDGGATWHPAQGRETWSYTLPAEATGPITIRSRAADDSAHLETPAPGVAVTVETAPCPCSFWDDAVVPSGSLAENDGQPLELGMKFRAGTEGSVTALRFYKSPSATGVHTGHLWAADGTQLAEVVFTGETAAGWQTVALPAPVPIAADTTYVVSYHGDDFYAQDGGFFATALDRPPLRALADGEDGPNGLYVYGPSAFPDQSFQSSNYWVDLVFEAEPPTYTAFQASDVPTTPAASDGQALEVGVKFQAEVPGQVRGLRFYKGAANTGTHTGHLWTAGGALLAEAVFTDETASGWQEVSLDPAVAIAADTTYVASYHSASGFFAIDTGFFTARVEAPPLALLSDGESGGNGVYVYSGAAAFPDQSGGGSNYWVDVSFVPDAPFDDTPPSVVSTDPADGAGGVPVGGVVRAVFSEALDPATLDAARFELRDSLGVLVPAQVDWDAPSRTATLTPDAPLGFAAAYTAALVGGSGGVADASGNELPDDVVWSFTTAGPPPDEGPGGPILVLSGASNPFGRYLAEIVRTEGLNAFTATDVANLGAALLSAHDVVLLGETPLSAGQVTLLSDFVTAGGLLVAMRPDAQLAGLLGLAPAGGTLSDAYLAIDTSAGPGVGLVAETIQFHGAADLYTLAGATELATLYSDATTATPYPAVTSRAVGAGVAAAFLYDLARSVVLTRQGNPAWSGQERDGTPPIRSDDLFYGAAAADPQPDWVDLSKVAIPQADEQQRLLANLVLGSAGLPLPRFWYLPSGHKAAVLMSGDEHGSGAGTRDRFDAELAADPPGCSLDDWECVRSSSYLYPTAGGLSDAEALPYHQQGFELGVHVNTGCADWTEASLESDFANQLGSFAALYPSLPAQDTQRTHCIAWSDYATQPAVELNQGIRLDTNYYFWPPSWVNDTPGLFTGSGLPMRFAALDGSMIDVFQAATQITDESDQTIATTIATLLDRALGPEGYYAVVTANMHTDAGNGTSIAGHQAIVAAAQARGVPVVSGRQMLAWLDGRNASSFSAIDWNGSSLAFDVAQAPGAHNLRALLPLQSPVGPLVELTLGGAPHPYDVEAVKGVQYAAFEAPTGSYVASYGADLAAPVISSLSAAAHGDGTATVSFLTDELADAEVLYGTSPGALGQSAVDAALATSHAVDLVGLLPGTTYFYRVVSRDAVGNAATEPAPPAAPSSFATPTVPCLVDTAVADFALGTPDASLRVADAAGGELMLRATEASEFDGAALPTGWSETLWDAGGSATVAGGVLVPDAALAATDASYAPGRALEFAASFGGDAFQHVGLGDDLNGAPWAIFSSGSGGQLLARTLGASSQETALGASLLGAFHVFRIEWSAGSVDYLVDGAPVASHAIAVAGAMRPVASDLHPGGSALTVDWMRLSPHDPAGSFVSRVADAAANASWGDVVWSADEPAATSIALEVRAGGSSVPDGSWTAWTPVALSGDPAGLVGRYAQYRASLASADPDATPALGAVTLACAPTCGNGALDPGEACDDGGAADGDGCSSLCLFEGPDADGDGLPNEAETGTGTYVSPTDTGSDPLDPDSDGDGAPDGLEVAQGTDPNDPADTPPDTSSAVLVDLSAVAGGDETRALALVPTGGAAVGTAFGPSGVEAFRWTEAGGLELLGDLPGGAVAGEARGVSADGAIVVGVGETAVGDEAFRHEAGVMSPLGDLPGGATASEAHATSADGAVVVGAGESANGTEAFRWEAGSMLGLGDLAGGGFESRAYAVSANGSVVVGTGLSGAGAEAFRWQSGVLTPLQDFPGGAVDSGALAVSPEGNRFAGYGTSADGREAVLWAARRVRLGELAGGAFGSEARGVSSGGRVVVGTSQTAAGSEAFVWTAATGMRRLEDVARDDFGLDLAGWDRLVSAEAISPDGTAVAGWGLRQGAEAAFVLWLDGACNDQIDNDGDLTADFGGDPGCSSPIDPSELWDCADGLDNDGDGAIDRGLDLSCGAVTSHEYTQCSNGIDDDFDGAVDWPADNRCRSRVDDDELRNPSCGLGFELVLLVILVPRRRRSGAK